MAQMTFFHYMYKDTCLHRMDGRLKLLCMLIVSISVSCSTHLWHYALSFILAAAALLISKLPITALLKDMRFFAVIILIVFLTNALTVNLGAYSFIPAIGFSIQGVLQGLRFASRIILIVMVCAVMTGTTSLFTFKNVIEWYLRPVPFIPEVRVATMINLTFVLLPVIFDSFTEMMDAQKARLVNLRKNPVKKIKFIVFPLLSRTLKRADEIAYAMESRCYCETRTRASFKTNKADWIILSVCLTAFLLIVFF